MNLLLLFQLSIGAILLDNIVLSRFLGICPLLSLTKSAGGVVAMGLVMTVAMAGATTISWGLEQFILVPLSIEYTRIFVYVLVIAGIIEFLSLIIQKNSPLFGERIAPYMPHLMINGAVLGVALLVADVNHYTQQRFSFLESIVFAVLSGVGFTITALLLSAIRERLELLPVPRSFKDLPVTFISAGLLGLALWGLRAFSALREPFFGVGL